MSFAVPSPFVWDPSFDVGSDAMNTQHKTLFTLISNLEKGRTEANFGALVALVVKHFADEEAFFHGKLGGDDEKAHKAIHQELVKTAQSLNPKAIDDATVAYLKNWLVTHIKGTDMKYKK